MADEDIEKRGPHEDDEDSEDDIVGSESDDDDSDIDQEFDTGLTENQCRLLYLISLYTRPAATDEEKEEWIRKHAIMVLVYEGIVAEILDYDYAPASEMLEGRRLYFNVSQEGKSDIDFLREEELINGLKLSSRQYIPVTCFQVSEKGMQVVRNISKANKTPVQELVYAPGTRNLLRAEWDAEACSFFMEDSASGYKRQSTVTDTEDVSYVSSAYVPQCLRHGGRPTLSNAHRAHECGDSDGSSIRDELDEIITLNSVSIIVAEFIPFGANQIVQLNQNLGSTERVQGGFFTAMVDTNSAGTKLDVDPGLTTVNILDYSLTNHINFEADIHYPEPPGVVQVETFGVSINSAGGCFYGMQVEAVLDRIKDNISLDHLARLLVDVHVDSSKIVDSVISAYQRRLLDLVFMDDAANRDKVNLLVANEITPHLTAEEYMDKGEYENELKQVLGDTRAAYDISEHDSLIFGAHGLLVAGPNSRHHEPLLCSYLQFISMDIFIRNFFQRTFVVLDDMRMIHQIITEYEKDPDSLHEIRARLAQVSKELILMREILEYMDESLGETEAPPEPPEQAGRSLFERLCINDMKTQLLRRTKDLAKNLAGASKELDVLKQRNDVVADNKMYRLHENTNAYTRQLCALQENNHRASSSLEVMQVVLAGSLAFDVLDRITGDWTVANTTWMSGFVDNLIRGTPAFYFFFNLGFWGLLGYLVIKYLRRSSHRNKGNITLSIKESHKIDIGALGKFLKTRIVEEEIHSFDGETRVAKVTWTEKNKREWGGHAPSIQLVYDENNSYMLSVELTYNVRQASKNLAFNSEELRTRMFQDLQEASVLVGNATQGMAPVKL